MSNGSPPVALKEHCSIIHNGILYVYQPDAFQTLSLEEGGKWSQIPNGVSVKGARCVKGGIDGDSDKPALYVVGGAANDTSSMYAGIQRYSILDKSWEIITPLAPVTQDRQYHGAAYMNASSAIVIFGGSQTGYTGATSETFLIEMYPPYHVQAYNSAAPPTIRPQMFSWDGDRALMVGGSSSNEGIYTFDPGNGWQNLGLALPSPLPDQSVAQSALLTLDDNSKILQTFRMDKNPTEVTTNVLLNPGGIPAVYGETVGGTATASSTATSSTNSVNLKRSLFLSNYPTYDAANAPTVARKDFSLAQGDGGFVAFVGGDKSDSVAFFNQSGNGWLSNSKVLGQQSSTPSSTTSSQGTATASSTSSAATAATSSGSFGKNNGLTILGAVLGGICGIAAVIIIFLLWLRRKRKRREEARTEKRSSAYLRDKRRSDEFDFEEGYEPLKKNGQPMGRSPVPSALISEADSTSMFGPRPSEKNLIRRVSSDTEGRLKSEMHNNHGNAFGQGMFRRDKSQLSISKPMMPNLGHYQERPSIDLGKATPAVTTTTAAATAAIAAPIVASKVRRNASQRKTDEGWARYFTGDRIEERDESNTPPNLVSPQSRTRSYQFWPGSGVPEQTVRTPGSRYRDSTGETLAPRPATAAGPNTDRGLSGSDRRNISTSHGVPVGILNNSANNHEEMDENEYEDDHVTTTPFSSGIPSSVPDTTHWSALDNHWPRSASNLTRHASNGVSTHDFAPETSSSSHTNGTAEGSAESKTSSIPSFPMPIQSIRPVIPSLGSSDESTGPGSVQQPAAAHYDPSFSRPNPPVDRVDYHLRPRSDYFGNARSSQALAPPNMSTDVSWLKLNTPPIRKR